MHFTGLDFVGSQLMIFIIVCQLMIFKIVPLLMVFMIVCLQCLINPRRACAERVTVVISCVCVCVSVCMYVCPVTSITKDVIVFIVRFAAIIKSHFS